MRKSRTVKKNSFVEGAMIATIAVIVTKILGMAYVIPFYKIIGSQGGALYSYAYNIYNIFLDVSSAGIPIAISKIISEYNTLGYKEAKYRVYKLGIKIISYLSVFAFLLMFVFADIIAAMIIGDITGGNSVEDIAFVIRCVSIAILIIPFLSVTKGYFQGHSIIAPTSVGTVIEQVVRISVILIGSFLAYKVFNQSLTLSVGIALTGAFFGGLIAYTYLKVKMKKNKEILGIKKYKIKDEISNKDIIKKIIAYAFPFVIISIATNIYNFTDMVLILRGLHILGFSAADAEFIQSAVTTWTVKICMIVNSFSIGMVVSLIPTMVSSFVKGDWEDVNAKINKAYQMIMIISIPCGVGLAILSTPVWKVFYGTSVYGPEVLRVMVISAIFANIYAITFNTMQSLNKYKTVYISVFVGFGVNALLDIPLMILFNKIGVPAYWGAPTATTIGYLVSIYIATHDLRHNHNMKFKSTYMMLLKIMVPTVSMTLILFIFNYLVHFDLLNRFSCILMIILNTLIGGIVYLGVAYKMNLFDMIFGKDKINEIIKKLTFNKVSLKNN